MVKDRKKGGRKGRTQQRKKTTKAATRQRRPRDPAGCFPALRRSPKGASGFGVAVAVVEGTDGRWDVAQVLEDRIVLAGRGVTRGNGTARAVRRIASKARVTRLSTMLAALGHPVRVRLMVKLLEGPATYRALQKVTRLKAGPLYHHINQLRLASLVLPKKRDLYAMARAGRNLLVASLALMSLCGDARGRV